MKHDWYKLGSHSPFCWNCNTIQNTSNIDSDCNFESFEQYVAYKIPNGAIAAEIRKNPNYRFANDVKKYEESDASRMENWLKKQIKLEDADEIAKNGVCFDPSGNRWQNLKSKIQPSDELWEYDNDQWKHLAGRMGYALLREGKIIDSVLVKLN